MPDANWISRIRAAFGASQPADEIVEELAEHAATAYQTARADGLSEAEALAGVDRDIAAWTANPERLRRRRLRSTSVVPAPPPAHAASTGALWQDARYAWRLVRRQKSYAALAITTIALGIAATSVVGSVAYGVLLKPLPWAGAPRLVRMYETRQGSTRRFRPMMTNGSYLAWREAPTTVDALGAWTAERVGMKTDQRTERLLIADVSPSLFPMLQAKPALGRLFADGDDEPGRPPIAILSHGLWQQQFGGREDAIGQAVRFDGTAYTIVGVMPAAFMFPDRETRAWVPYYVTPVSQPGSQSYSISMFQALARLKPGVTAEQAAAEATARGRTVPNRGVVAMAVFGSNGPVEITAVPMLQALTGDVRPAILVLFAAVALLLVTATANVASLQLARAVARRRELAIRTALGAARLLLVRQTLVENVLLALLGGAAGVILGAVMHRALPSVLPAGFPRLDDVAFGWRIQAFAVAVALLAGLGCGLFPALHAARSDVAPALVEDSLAPVGGDLRTRTGRTRAAIMVAQVAIACVLLIGASLLSRSFLRLMNADLGYDANNLLTARLILADGEYSPQRRLAIMREVTERLRSTPGVVQAAYATSMPFTSGEMLSSSPLKKRDGSTVQVQTGVRQISPGYFAALGQRVAEGREFQPADQSASERAVIVNREYSRKYLDGQALGWNLYGQNKPGTDTPTLVPIVGVVEDTVRHEVTDTPQPEVYYTPSSQPNGDIGAIQASDLNLIVRTASVPKLLLPSLRAIVNTAAPAAPLESVMTMTDRVGESLARPRLYAILLGTFAVFALTIAGVGLFGLLSYAVAQRAREIGVRAALGAQVRDIVGLVARQSLAIAGAGVAIGLGASVWLTRALQTFLYGVTTHDRLSYLAVAVLLIAIAVLATIVPARRAASVDPVRVLRG